MIYEGEYLNENRWKPKACDNNNPNGRIFGCEYDSDTGSLVFEGEYLNGARNGIGKQYDDYDGKLIYEGEYLNGLRNGRGKEYNPKDMLIFEGEYSNGLRWNGKLYDMINKTSMN